MGEKREEQHSIFEKPIPIILDEIQVAAADARKAADEARSAEEIATEVMRRLRKLSPRVRTLQRSWAKGKSEICV